MLWECWMIKFSIETKNALIGYALNKYGPEKRESLESAYLTRNLWNRLDNEE